MSSFYSHGKLLLTGEYAVLKGAKALAVPCKLGQFLTYKEKEQTTLYWKSLDSNGRVWFEAKFDIVTLQLQHTSADEIWENLLKLLRATKQLNPQFLKQGGTVETKLEFKRSWGLGSSSTLVSALSLWAKVDPYLLLEMSFGGSGYDIACAQAKGPLIYSRINKIPEVETVSLSYPFIDQLYFVYLNKKRDSQEAVARFDKSALTRSHIQKISMLTAKILAAKEQSEFNTLLQIHEETLAELLKQKPIQESLFSDFKGVIKSLGAWGGDFVLASANYNPIDYFTQKGYRVVIPFKEMVL
ncbi:MAG: GYDIA family GHMP kinase [Flavobacteriaceae bacterium]